MEELTKDAAAQAVDLAGAWKNGNVNQRQELAMAFFPEGLFFSHERKFFEPSNLVIQQMLWRYTEEHEKVGVPDGRILNQIARARAALVMRNQEKDSSRFRRR
jgi:hypothetical protein